MRLTPESNGNASGIGMADFTTKALVDAIDLEASNINAVTSMVTTAVRIPITFDTDKMCLETGLNLARRIDLHNPRIGRIKNTMELEKFWVTVGVADELRAAGDAESIGEPEPFGFDESGVLAGLAT